MKAQALLPSRRRFLIGASSYGAAGVAFLGAGRAFAQGGALQRFPMDQLEIVTREGTRAFTVEVARTPRQQAQGLMFRHKLPAKAGMLFLYDSPRIIRMWMKNTYIPLDMVFIDATGEIVSIAERTIPESLATISSGQPAAAVLEVNAGTVSRLGIRVGDKVRYAAFGTAG